MNRRVMITGVGPLCAWGIGATALWQGARDGQCRLGPIQGFDPSGFPCRIAGEAPSYKIAEHVPKTYRKATKVMARDIEMAAIAAAEAARDAGLVTKGLAPDATPTYPSARVGCHIGAGLIAADLNELAAALVQARDEQGNFSFSRWGAEGMKHLTPLWLLKYLPNMLACHVTIIHDTQGPSNTITCSEASSHLSLGESLRVIQRGAADMCFCGGADSRLNPMAYLRQIMTGRVNSTDNEQPAQAVRPMCQTAAGTVPGEGGAILVLEALDQLQVRQRQGVNRYAEVIGFGASQTVHLDEHGLPSDPEGEFIALAIETALDDADLTADQVDMIVPEGLGDPTCDAAEAAALRRTMGPALERIPLVMPKAWIGAAGAGAGALDLAVAAHCLLHQWLPPVTNCPNPRPGLMAANRPGRDAVLRHVLVLAQGQGGQNAAVVLRRADAPDSF